MRSRRCASISFQAAVLTSFQCFEAHISCCEGALSFVQNAVLGEVGWGGGASQSVAHLEQVGGVGWLGWGGAGFAYGRLPSSGIFSSTRESICTQRFA